ncbi:hypothetical protein [Sphingorhabdus sp.]|uniref:hypothetical protein n=1 Tax=Sphingorhabdus sp. TaxID=1902408 RepID=UPI0039832ECF
MTQERITETTNEQGTLVERTIERDTGPAQVTVNTSPSSGGSGMGVIAAIVLLLVLAVGGYMLFNNSGSEERKDNAVAKAAGDVGDAAQKAGAAVEKAADKMAN